MIKQKSGKKNMTDSLISEYNTMKKRYKKLVLEGKKLQKEHDADVKYFIDNHISDRKWQDDLETTACNLASSSLTMKIAKAKMTQIKNQLKKK